MGGVGPRRREGYCHFPSPRAFIRGYWAFLERGRYIGWERYSDTPMEFIRMLWEGGYAAAPNHIDLVARRLAKSKRLLEDSTAFHESYQDQESGIQQEGKPENLRNEQVS